MDARLAPLRHEARILHRTDHDDRGVRIKGEDAAARLNAVGIGQVHVHRHSGRTRLLVFLNGLGSVARYGADLEARLLEDALKHRLADARVVDNHDLDFIH